ncbi:hypothetical protein ACJ41O_005542 [Fusarium nematophilum]
MLEPADLSSPAVGCMLVLFATSICLNFWLVADRSKHASIPKLAVHSETPTSDQPQKLPKGWWTDSAAFQIERRAIFSKTWICVSHRGRFVKPGDYVSYDLAGFKFFLILGKDDVVRAFHNVCRHRAYPVTRKASGSSIVLGCGYHGWSYDTRGRLTKAPQFDQVPGFNKGDHSLFEIHTRMDEDGFVHVNLSGSIEGVDSRLLGAETVGRPARINPRSQLLHSWEYKGKFDWKVAVNGRQNGSEALAESPSRGIFGAFSAKALTPMGQLQFFPVTTVYTKSGSPIWYQVTCSPDSAGQSTLRCDVYSSKRSDSTRFDDAFKDRLESHMKATVENYEKTYSVLRGSKNQLGIGSRDQLRIVDAVEAHLEKEKAQGREINPAAVQQCKSAAFDQAEEICKAMECGSVQMAW